jgi:hypothetical protein
MDPSVASFGPFRRTVGPPRVATMSRPDCGTTTARNDACSLVQPLITHGKRQMAATSGHPFSEAHCVGDAVAVSQASDITARHDCQHHTQSSLWRGDTLKSGTPVGFDISASTSYLIATSVDLRGATDDSSARTSHSWRTEFCQEKDRGMSC